MKHNIPVECLVDRSWNPMTKIWEGRAVNGMLIDFISQSADDSYGKLIPAGIVILDSGALESVPVEFITTA